MDKKDFPLIREVNGFEIRLVQFNGSKAPFRIFHPSFDGVYIVDYHTLAGAEAFCEEENAESWAEELREEW